MFSGGKLEGRKDGAELTGADAKEPAAAVQDGAEEKLKWVIDKVEARSRQPLRLMGSWETASSILSTSAPPSSELGASRVVSEVISEQVPLGSVAPLNSVIKRMINK